MVSNVAPLHAPNKGKVRAISRPDDRAPDDVMLVYYGPHALQPLEWSRAPSAKSQSWKTEPLRWFNVIRRAEKPQVSESKDGEAVCYVALDGPPAEGRDKVTGAPWKAAEGTTRRKYENLVSVYFIGFDYDTGEIPAEEMVEHLKTLGYEAVFYTTHSHLKTVTTPSDVDRREAAKLNLDIVTYMKAVGKLPRIDDPAPQLLPDGGISHAPWSKFRVVLLLKVPFVIGKDRANVARYKNGYHALAKLVGASTIDPACVDPARIHYPPKKRSKDATYVYTHICGQPVDFEAIVKSAPAFKSTSATAPRQTARAPTRLPQVAHRADAKATVESHTSIEHANDGALAADYTDQELRGWLRNFNFATALAAAGIEVRRDMLGEGKIEICCPFDETHSNAGDPNDTACFVADADVCDVNGFGYREAFIGCHHSHCKSRLPPEFVSRMLADGTITPDLFSDTSFKSKGSNPISEMSPAQLAKLRRQFGLPQRRRR